MGKLKYPKDLTGIHFGELTVLRYAGDLKWECKCSCGEIRIIPRNNLVSGNSTSCGHNSKKDSLVDISGETFGELVVETYDKEHKRWKCKCSCGNIVYRRSWDLRNGKAVKCDSWENHTNKKLEHLEGKVFGELEVLEYSGGSVWKCRCSCGMEAEVKAVDLKSGRVQRCSYCFNKCPSSI